MTSLKYSILLFAFAGSILFFSACEKTKLEPNDDPIEPQGNKLLEVIEEDNIWGGKVITEVDRVMSLLRTTDYTLSNYVTDVEGGYLIVDCSKYVETILKEVSATHYNKLPKSSTSGLTSLAKDYYNHFVSLPFEHDGNHCWIRINNLEDVCPGDIISYIHEEEGSTTGHVMIICSYPVLSEYSPIDYSLVVNDAANSGHFEDTRNKEGIYAEEYDYIARLHFDNGVIKYSGVGIGAMWFHMDENSYYRWSSGTSTSVNKNIAIGRMIDIPVI